MVADRTDVYDLTCSTSCRPLSEICVYSFKVKSSFRYRPLYKWCIVHVGNFSLYFCHWISVHKNVTELLSRQAVSNHVIAKLNTAVAGHDENLNFWSFMSMQV